MRTSLFTDAMPALPDDGEMETITRYTTGQMTDVEAYDFETRLTTDRAFFYRTMPMLKVWYARKPTAAEIGIVHAAAERPALTLHRGESARHVRGAIGSYFELKTILRTMGIAAAVALLYVVVPHDRARQRVVPSKTMTQAPATTPELKTPPQVASTPTVNHPRPKTLAIRPGVSQTADSAPVVGVVPMNRGDSAAVAAATASPRPDYSVTEPAAVVGEGPMALPITITTPPIDSSEALLQRIKDIANDRAANGRQGWRWHWPSILDPRNWFGRPPMRQSPPTP